MFVRIMIILATLMIVGEGGESHNVQQWVYRSGFDTVNLDFGQYVFTPAAIGSTGNKADWLIRRGQLVGNIWSAWPDSSIAMGDVGNIGIPWNFSWEQGDTNVCFFDLDSNAGTIDHRGFYAVVACTLISANNYDTIRMCTLRQVPVPSVEQPDDPPVRVQVTWTKPVYDTSTIVSSRVDWNPIRGYAVYRSTDGINFTRVDTGLAMTPVYGDTFLPYDTLAFEDSSVVVDQTYYYALRLIYWGSQIKEVTWFPDTIIIGSVLSANSDPIKVKPIRVEESPEARPGFRVQISPNPTRKSFRIEFSLPGSEEIDIIIYNLLGCRLREWHLALPSGDHAEVLDTRAIPGGVYFLVLKTASGQSVVRKVVIK
ncbi:MAG TPA: T9SS type A sorting domain-containing protein [bacterium (Candidatus Stahlbacteria)]|nr:T9SS type A sorting domain-containing protein [Candidatus Stahlbacteria bacterium]